ncbi:MAG TPA: M48 family metallopeptidase [Dokdonella sp.]|uniref:M48 family metallopeptidase n=1 Tax=Dokdonella sp. TaxID=2291710 RepID=UPI002D7F92B5|nr:M48 family metallopeptidase [Dokdonella sp.]HET9033975.1 M48 family metallopeptidase [Dokdonella sp.]
MGLFGNRSSQGRRRGLKIWPILFFGLYFGYYYLSHSNEASFTGRKQLLDTSAQEEAALGLQSYREILQQSQVVRSGKLPEQVQGIAQRLVEAAPKVEKYLADTEGTPANTQWDTYQWQVSLIQSDQVNAFCLPGGKIAVYTGIIPVAKNNDGLAVIMGHEIAHALLRHGGERMAQQKLVQIGSIAASMSTGEMDPGQRQMVMAAIGAGAQYGVLLPFSRSHESEADKVGLLLAAAACYNPQEAPKLWERMAAMGKQKPPEFMSTHPAEGTRINQLNAWMPEAMQVRQQFCGTTPTAQ